MSRINATSLFKALGCLAAMLPTHLSADIVVAQTPLVAEPQVPTGQFTTATEVRPILTVTRGNWVAVREFNGQDLVYLTHLLAWRCGLVAIRFGVNGGAMAEWPMPPCQIDTASPNALPNDHLPYVGYALKSVESLQIEIVYDDLTTDSAEFERKAVLMP
jgi:hypothetical protein